MADSESDNQDDNGGDENQRTKIREATRKRTSAEELDIEVPQPDLSWMDKSLEWGVRVKPSKKGLTLGSLNVGIYGHIPDYWEDQTRMSRGAYPAPGVRRYASGNCRSRPGLPRLRWSPASGHPGVR